MKPAKNWNPLGEDTYRLVWTDDTAWVLKPTPRGSRYPWVLQNSTGTKQDIGDATLSDALGKAEMWLEITSHLLPLPRAAS